MQQQLKQTWVWMFTASLSNNICVIQARMTEKNKTRNFWKLCGVGSMRWMLGPGGRVVTECTTQNSRNSFVSNQNECGMRFYALSALRNRLTHTRNYRKRMRCLPHFWWPYSVRIQVAMRRENIIFFRWNWRHTMKTSPDLPLVLSWAPEHANVPQFANAKALNNKFYLLGEAIKQ